MTGGGSSTWPVGMFSFRNPEVIKPLQISMPSSGNVQHTIVDQERWSDYVKMSPLGGRAWVFQERLLSPRILHFGVDEIFWECSSSRASETFPGGEPVVEKMELGAKETPVRAQSDVSDNEDILNLWLDVVEAYTKCDLTYPSDKLFALAGLAKHFKSKFGLVDYMAGLWRTRLETQLLWRVQSSGITKRSEIYRAPSWCWASIDGPIWPTWAEEVGEMLIEVLEASVSLGGTDPFGHVISGSLRLKGRMLKGKVASDAHYFPGLRLLFDENLNEIAYHPDEDLKPDLISETELFCMPVSVKNVEDGSDDDGKESDDEVAVRIILQGLVLRPTYVTHGQYRRVGTFKTVVPSEVEKIMQTRLLHLEDIEYEAFAEPGLFTVSII
jgi:hypothetical protein